MHKLILEVCDGTHASLCEPVIVEELHDLPLGVMQAVEDFIDAHDGALSTPLVITARKEDESEMPCGTLFPAAITPQQKPAHR